jgi:peptidoglycan/xylan/chitin deacetylase (PgdA/CDA1 family)
MVEGEMGKLVKHVLYEVAERFVAPILAPIYSGIGSILMFHRLVESPPERRAGWPHELEARPALIEALFSRLRRSGHEFVSIGELRETLIKRKTHATKLVVVTFDDGYTDTYDTVFPLLTGYKIPFTLYLTTDFPDRRMVPWWYLLERLLTQKPRLALETGGRELSYRLETQKQRDGAFDEVAAVFDKTPPSSRRALAERVFGKQQVARSIEDLCIRWDQVAEMAAHPLVTIGAHTVSHPVLKLLPREEACREMVESRRRIEAALGQPVRHFAYPYGWRTQVGAREYALAKECGFETAVTTRVANVFHDNAGALECLPRIYGRSLRQIELLMTGAVAAFRHRGLRVITL